MKRARYTIGLLIDFLEMSYSGTIIRGCVEAAKQQNVNLLIYPGGAINENRSFDMNQVGADRYSGAGNIQKTILYEYAKQDDLDGVIISVATIGMYLSEAELKEFIASFSVPVLLLEQEVEGYPCLRFTDTGIALAVRHLITECGRKRIGYLSGPLENEDARQRLAVFRDAMEEYGCPVREELIAYGDFSPFCREAAERLFRESGLTPDAVCVANDAMCIPLYEAIRERGMTPGKEIAVTGYDNSNVAKEIEPMLTSVNADPKRLGETAVRLLLERLRTGTAESRILDVELLARQSSGKREEVRREEETAKTAGIHSADSLKNVFINSIATDMMFWPEDRSREFQSVKHNLEKAGITEAYIYTYEQPFSRKREDPWKVPDTLFLQLAYGKTEENREVPVAVCGKEIVEKELADGEQHILVCYPIEVVGEHYGIMHLGYEPEFCMDIFSIANQLATAFRTGDLIVQLGHATKAKSAFLANMSHEIRTPLNAVLGMNEMILRESRDDAILKYASYIRSSGNTLLSLINEILDLSKIESGKMEIVPVDYDTGGLIADLYHMIQPRAQKKKLSFVMDIAEDIPKKLHGDDVRIRQVLTNLLTNAVKYTQEGTVTFCLQWKKTEERKAELLAQVRDTGIGIREEDMERLFSDFQRLDQEKNRNIEGTGLGMGITVKFLEMMGSALEVQSAYGQGSVFSFCLEQEIVDETPMGSPAQQPVRKTGEEQTYRSRLTAPKAKLLVVDDNEMNRIVIRKLLKITGAGLDTADSGAACLDCVKAAEYDLIFLDHMMPDMDGVETLQRVRRMLEEQGRRIPPIIVLTANAIAGARESYLEAGFTDYLSKPIDAGKLEEMLLQYLPQDLIEEGEPAKPGEAEAAAPAPVMWEPVTGLDLYEAMQHNPDEETFRQMISVFCKTMPGKAACIEEYEKKEQIRDYTIQVHALKSASRLIGATALSCLAQELEQAGNAQDLKKIHEETGLLLSLYRKYGDFLKDYLPKNPSCGFKEPEIPLLEEKLKAVGNAMENFDLDAADAIMQELEQIRMPERIREPFETLQEYVLNFKVEETPALVNGMCRMLQEEKEEA